MFGKKTRFLTMMAAALGVPYAWFNENFSGPIRNTLTSLHSVASSVTANRNGQSSTASASRIPPSTFAASTSGVHASGLMIPSIHQLTDVLRFDISPRWVIDQWGRVSTVHAEQNLEGLRVPLVTGTNVDDITGSLTYYFDAQRRVRRITLHGQTGDERTLVAIGTTHFGLRQEPSLRAGAFINRWNAMPMNALLITHAPVVRGNARNTQLTIELELNDLQAGYRLSPDIAQRLLSTGY
jgi:hypothetical protein